MTPLNVGAYKNIVILTGAGVSAPSGLGTYRGPGGLWEKNNVAFIADARNLPASLPDVWRLYRQRRQHSLAAVPNAAHHAIAALQNNRPEQSVTLITQNVDGLHQRAGSLGVIEVHGSAFTTRCTNEICTLPPFRDEAIYNTVPVCRVCGSPLRPGVVLFHEPLSNIVIARINQAMRLCDLFLSVGTSGTVAPAAGLVRAAALVGARTICVNREPLLVPNSAFGEEYLGLAEELLPVLLRT